jgi:hypothetical protein
MPPQSFSLKNWPTDHWHWGRIVSVSGSQYKYINVLAVIPSTVFPFLLIAIAFYVVLNVTTVKINNSKSKQFFLS